MLEQFSFSRMLTIPSVLFTSYSVDMAKGRFTIKNFRPGSDLYFPDGRDLVGMRFIVLRIDLESYESECVISESAITVFSKTDLPNSGNAIDVVLKAKLPEGDGLLIGVLFVANCEEDGEGYRWFRNRWSVMGVVGVR